MVRKIENIQWAAVVWTEMPWWCQKRMGRLVRDDRKSTVTQITTRYSQDMQNTISERTTRRTLKQMGYSSRRPHRVPLLSAKNRKLRLQFAQAHQNWAIEVWKNVAWSDESRFLLQHSDGRVRIWKELKNMKAWMNPSCLVSTVQAGGGGGVMVWGIFSLGPVVPIEHCLNATAYPSIVADHIHPFLTTVYPSSDGYFQQDNAPCHKAQIISDWFLEHDNEFPICQQILKEQITDDRVFFKMPFHPCPSGCGRFLSADDGHDRCLQCLGRRHAEAAFVDDSCVCCGRMSMISLRSRLSFMKGLAPSASTRADLSGSSRGSPAYGLGDLRVTVRASLPGTPPRTSYSSRSEHPVRFRMSHGAPSISIGAPSVDRMSIVASGDGFTFSEDEGAVGLPPSGVVATAAPDPELTAMLARAAVSIGLEVNRPPSPEPSRLDDWFLGAGRALPQCLSSRRCMRSWRVREWPLSRPEAARPPPPSSLPSMAEWPGGTRAFPRWRERSRCTCVLGGTAADRGDPAHPAPARCTIHPYSLSLHHHRYVDCAVGAACTASGGVAQAAQPVSLAHAHNSTRLRDSVRQATSQVQRRSRDVGGSPERPCLARGDCCPPGKGCNRAGPSSRDEAGVLQPLLLRTQERWWPSANPGSASLEPGFTQAPVQDADAQAHDQMHSAPGLVCSDRPEGRLLSRFDPSVTQTVSTVCVRRSGMAVQGPPLRAIPVSPCVHEGCRGRPYPVTGSGRQDPQLPQRLAYSSPIQRAVGRSQGLGAPAPQPVGASGQLGKEQALPCAENLFSRCGVRLGEYDGMPHGGPCPSSAELPEFLQRQKCGTTETVSEAPGAYGIRSCSHAARIASYETTSALATLPGPEVGMAPRYTASRYLPAVSPLLQPLDRPCLSTGRGAPRTSVPAYCCHNRCLQHGLGHYMQRAGSLGALDRAPTALAHQLPGAVGSAFSLAAVPATAVGQARASPHGQHCGGIVYQPAGGYTITPHVTARPPSPPLESHAVQVTACCSHPGAAQSCGRRAVTTAHVPRRMATTSRDDPADLESIRESSGRPVCLPRVLPLPAVLLPDRGPPRAQTHWHTAGLGPYASMRFPQWAYLHRHCASSGRTRSRSCWLRPIGPPGPGFPNSFPSRQYLPGAFLWGRTSFLRGSAPYGTRAQIYGTSMCGSWTGRGRLEWSTTGGGRDHHSG